MKLDIEIDKRSYQLGDTVYGTLKLQLDKPAKINCLYVGLHWQTYGVGITDSDTTNKIILHQGTLHPGTYIYNFELFIDKLPISYNGDYLKIKRSIIAQVEIPYGFDTTLFEEFDLNYSDELKYAINSNKVTKLPSFTYKQKDKESKSLAK